MPDFSIQLTVQAKDGTGAAMSPTAVELAAALMFSHRVINRIAEISLTDKAVEAPYFDTLRNEPYAINFEIKSANIGSVILAGIIAAVSDPFVQGVASGIMSNILTDQLNNIINKTKGIFRRLSKASAGRELEVTLDIEHVKINMKIYYSDEGRTTIEVNVGEDTKQFLILDRKI